MKKIKLICLVMAVLSVFSLFGLTAYGEESEASLTIKYPPGVCNFSFYRVADFSSDDGLTLTSVFNQYSGNVQGLNELPYLDAVSLRDLASTLESVVKQNSIIADYTASSDESGMVKIDNIVLGTYLILGEKKTYDGFTYTPSPVLVSVPSGNTATGLEYKVVIEHTKYEKTPVSDNVSLKVMKVWKDEGNTDKRPDSVTVQLLKDYVVAEVVTLNADNNWVHEWKNLSSDNIWKVVETDVPEGYKMSVSVNGNLYVIENTFSSGDKEETTTAPERETTKDSEKTTEPTTKDNKETTNRDKTTTKVTTTGGSDGDGGGDDEVIIETGQLWWPVPILALAGVALIGMGIAKRKEEQE